MCACVCVFVCEHPHVCVCVCVHACVSIYLPICFTLYCTVFQQQTDFTGVMATPRFTDNRLYYYKGKCSFSGQPMPTADGDHVYNLKIDPGQSPNGNNLFAGPRLTIR